MKYCPYCGAQLAQTAVKCHSCKEWLDITKRPPWAKEVDDLWAAAFKRTRAAQATGGPTHADFAQLGADVYDYVASQIERGAPPPWMWKDPSPDLKRALEQAGVTVGPTAKPAPQAAAPAPQPAAPAPQPAAPAPQPAAPAPQPAARAPQPAMAAPQPAAPAPAPQPMVAAPAPAPQPAPAPSAAPWQPPASGGWQAPTSAPAPAPAQVTRGQTEPGNAPSPLLNPPGAMPSAPAPQAAPAPEPQPAPAPQPQFAAQPQPQMAPQPQPQPQFAPQAAPQMQAPTPAAAPITPTGQAPADANAATIEAPPVGRAWSGNDPAAAGPAAGPAAARGLMESPQGPTETRTAPGQEGAPSNIPIDRLKPGKPTKPRRRSFTREFLGETFVEQAEMAEAAAAAGVAAAESGDFDSTFGEAVSAKNSIPWKWVVLAVVVAAATGGAIVAFGT